MVELFLGLVMLVIACAAWQFLPVFRTVVKQTAKWTLIAAFVGGLVLWWWIDYSDRQTTKAQHASFMSGQWIGPGAPAGCGITQSGIRYCADK